MSEKRKKPNKWRGFFWLIYPSYFLGLEEGERENKNSKGKKKRNRFLIWLLNPQYAMGLEAADRENDKTTGRHKRRIRRFWAVGWLFFLIFLYAGRPDWAYAITIWPAWIGMFFGIFLTILSRTWRTLIAIGYLIFGLYFVDEMHTIPRMVMPEPPHDLRVVSLNCAGGSPAAAEEVQAQNPDIILFQESCRPDVLQRLATKFFGTKGSVLIGSDASIIARGHLKPLKTHRGTIDYVAAEWSDDAGHHLKLMSLRLSPPTMRVDLYNPEAWNAFSADRASRRHETESIAAELATLSFQSDLMGGDFNSPPDKGQVGSLTNGKMDTFAEAGVGYGATCVNPFPCLVRIDQLWHSTAILATRSRVVGTENSDHRMLVSDFRWK